ncbi:hypothetical protein B5F77_00910 [Parabacteroides sp. An277]|uniref:lipocalin-like domain-containing protein n=1 Tax=Parabacteroides sp. An277 TaxID=1965619 RepID=UPI000B37E13D|nr:lipocalin-like domain-containing protein [Parabacteroides sp. An277]OUO55794.1 hypothetical protein B5F77_00910 [Parabacteroides sp. An277]
MKKKTIIGIGVWACVSLLGGCDKMTTDLEGQWQLNTIEAEGEVQQVDTVWYNFQTSLFRYQIYAPQTDTWAMAYGYNTYEGERLSLRLFIDDSNPDFLGRTDWEADTRDFIVEEVGGKRMVLRSEGKTYTFTKY